MTWTLAPWPVRGSTISAMSSSDSSVLRLTFLRLCVSEADTTASISVTPASSARWAPRRFGHQRGVAHRRRPDDAPPDLAGVGHLRDGRRPHERHGLDPLHPGLRQPVDQLDLGRGRHRVLVLQAVPGPTSRIEMRAGRSAHDWPPPVAFGSRARSAARQTGGRFSAKAAMPSRRSADMAAVRQAASSTSSAAARLRARAESGWRGLAARTATGELAAIRRASSRALSVAVPAGHPAVGQPDPLGLGGRDLAAGEHQVGGPAGADPAGRELGAAAAGDQADGGLGQAEHGGLVGHDDVAGQRELAAAAEGEAVHGGDDRLRHGRAARRTRPGRPAAGPGSARRSWRPAPSGPRRRRTPGRPRELSTMARTPGSAPSRAQALAESGEGWRC